MSRENSPLQLRRFSLTVGAGLAIIGGVLWLNGHATIPTVLWSIAGLLILLGMVWPRVLSPVHTGWMALAMGLAWVNTRIILSVLFYAVITPVGVVLRWFRDPLDRRLQDEQVSYWVRREPQSADQKIYERQF